MKVSPAQLSSAVSALKQYAAKKDSTSEKLFGSDDQMVTLQISLSEVPPKALHKPVRIKLPNPFYTLGDACVIVKDDDKDRLKRNHHKKRKLWKNLVKAAEIKGVKKVISAKKLKSEYKQYEQKRKLAQSFDIFLCDAKIIEIMPRELGSLFYKKRHKIPVPVKILHPGQEKFEDVLDVRDTISQEDAKSACSDIEDALSSTVMQLSGGPTVGVRVGKLDMGEKELAENLDTVIKACNRELKRLFMKADQSVKASLKDMEKERERPEACFEIRQLHVSATDCISLPLYQAEEKREVVVKKKLLEKAEVKADSKEAKKAAKEALAKIVGEAKKGMEKLGKKVEAESDSEETKVSAKVKKNVGGKKTLPLLKGSKKKVKKAPY